MKAITHPAVGNHEYDTSRGRGHGLLATANAAGYFAYFGAAAGDPAKGYYSYDVGAWHLIALNSNCGDRRRLHGRARRRSSGSQPTSPRTRARCTLAYWHHPRF